MGGIGRARPLPQASGTICLIIKDEPAHPTPAPSGYTSQPPWATFLSLWIWTWAQAGPFPAPAKRGDLGDLPGGSATALCQEFLTLLPEGKLWQGGG